MTHQLKVGSLGGEVKSADPFSKPGPQRGDVIVAQSLTPEQFVMLVRGIATATNGEAPPPLVAAHIMDLALRVRLSTETPVRTGCGCGGRS